MKVKALIAARSGSIRVQNKNIRPFADSTLLEVKIKQLQRLKNLDGIVINSNDELILDIAQSLGTEIVRRDSYYASNEVSMSDVYKNMAENIDCDVIVYANCTNPLILDKTIYDVIEFYKENYNQKTKTFEKEISNRGCVGSIAEIYDSTKPYAPKGAFSQAWSVAEILRIII